MNQNKLNRLFSSSRNHRSTVIFILLLIFSAIPSFSFQAKKKIVARTQQAIPTDLAEKVKSILRSSSSNGAQWGVLCIDLVSGKRILELNAEKRLVPGSVSKLFTTSTALSRLGPDFIYKTTVEAGNSVPSDGRLRGDLILKGRGDPNLSARVLPYDGRTERADDPARFIEDMARKVVASGLKRVDGDLIVDDSYFVNQPYGEGWTVGDLVWGYGAPVSAMVVNDSVVIVDVLPGQHPGDPAIVLQKPLPSYFTTINRVKTSERSIRTQISLHRPLGSRQLSVWGSIAPGEPDFRRSIAQDDPPRYSGLILREKLEALGVKVQGEVKFNRLEPDQVSNLETGTKDTISAHTTFLAVHDSLPLKDSLKIITKVSQNLHAEMLLRTVGKERRGVGSVEAGLKEINDFLREIGVKEDQVSLRDGSGLSRESLTTPSAILAILKHMYDSKYRDLWIDLLPIAGEDGSLINRYNRSVLEGHLKAKTGSLSGVAALAGYVMQNGKHPLAIVVMINNGNASHATATDLIDKVVLEVAHSQ